MAQDQKHPRRSSSEQDAATESTETDVDARREALDDDVDAILAETDEVRENYAEAFLKSPTPTRGQ